jgi:hypothetical protein
MRTNQLQTEEISFSYTPYPPPFGLIMLAPQLGPKISLTAIDAHLEQTDWIYYMVIIVAFHTPTDGKFFPLKGKFNLISI